MQNFVLEEEMDFLFRAAIRKCQNVEDAEDLTQDTLLAAVQALKRGEIRDLRAWLLKVMNYRFYDLLRKKYRQPQVIVGEHPDDYRSAGGEWGRYDEYFFDGEDDEAVKIRAATAQLSKIYREVIIRHYMEGQSVAEIAEALNIPAGTVKSRLYLGRNHIKEGIVYMEKYTKQSYSPVSLMVNYSGRPGRNEEPVSLVEEDLMAQNILWFAYEEPASIEEISQATGIPAAYVEPVAERLTAESLMKKTGKKYYTDFIIYTVKDRERWIPDQKQLVKDEFEKFWTPIQKGLDQIREREFYKRCTSDATNSLELYFAFRCLDYGLYHAFEKNFGAEQNIPDRPHGGRWTAFGYVYTEEFHPMGHLELMAGSYSGERWVRFDSFEGSNGVELHVYGAEGFPGKQYDRSSEYDFLKKNENIDEMVTRLLYRIHTQGSMEIAHLQAIPWLKQCKIVVGDGKWQDLKLNIPVFNGEEAKMLWKFSAEAREEMTAELKELLADFYRGKKIKLPSHLVSVPTVKQYMHAGNAIVFAVIREAIRRGNLYDGGYDKENQFPCPMILVIDNS